MAAGDVLVTIKAKVDSVQNAIKAVQQLEEVIVKVSKKKFKIEGLAETASGTLAVGDTGKILQVKQLSVLEPYLRILKI